MKRGVKPKNAANSRRRTRGVIRHDEMLEPASLLTLEARVEYDRLAGVLRQKGTLDRVDLGVITEAARVKALLDRLHSQIEENLGNWRVLNRLVALTAQRHILLRSLGLTTVPSGSVVKANPIGSAHDESGQWQNKLKVSG